MRMPVLFLAHGSPMNAIESNHYSQTWAKLGQRLPKPNAILVISAHWYLPDTAVTALEQPETLHDFGGFPQALFDLQYPAPGSPQLAAEIASMLAEPVRLATDWGLDHGAWSLLVHLYPQADIPVLQLSLDSRLSPVQHLKRAERLLPLREQGVLILASGNLVHNLQRLRWQDAAPVYDWAIEFNRAVRSAIEKGDRAALADYLKLSPNAQLSVPTPEHYLPLLYAMALQQTDEQVSLFHDQFELAAIGMLSLIVCNSNISKLLG